MAENLVKYINTRIGTDEATEKGSIYGNTTVGPQNPNSSISPGPQTYPASKKTGYLETGKIRGFTQLHFGTGGATKFGQFLISPQIGLSTGFSGHDSEKSNEACSPVEYKVFLDDYNIDCSLTPSSHSAIYKFIYPKTAEGSIIFDVEHYFGETEEAINPSDLNISVVKENGKTIISGSGYYRQGWANYSVYYYAEINVKATETGTYISDDYTKDKNVLFAPGKSGNGTGAYIKFFAEDGQNIIVKLAVSFRSIEKAKEWLEIEIPHWDYEKVKQEGIDKWNSVLDKIVIDENTSEQEKTIFYTSLYHASLNPCDRTGDVNIYGDAPLIDNHIAVWDTWRTVFPLHSIINPEFIAKTVNSFITRYKVDGMVRDLFIQGCDYANQGGDDVDNIVADALSKNIDGISKDELYDFLLYDANKMRTNHPGGQIGGASDYRELGWIDGKDEKKRIMCCSMQLEYAYNDFVTALIARKRGDMETYKTLITRSNSWTNIWNDEITDTDRSGKKTYKGFIWPKGADGKFVEKDDFLPHCTKYSGSWKPYFYETTSYDHSFFVPQDVFALIEKMGGEDEFLYRLTQGVKDGGDRDGYVLFYNEPAFLTHYLSNYTSKPYHTTENVAVMRELFTDKRFPGDEDSGAMGAWYIFSSIGFFPQGGQNFYYITSPCYKSVKIDVGNGKTFEVKTKNFSKENKYIQSITLNGKPYFSTKLKHKEIVSGGEIVFTMGSTPINYAKSCNAEIESIKLGNEEAEKLGYGAYEIKGDKNAVLKVELSDKNATLSEIKRTDYGFAFTVTAEDEVSVKEYSVFAE